MAKRIVKLSGGNRVECVGESFYVEALREVVGSSGKDRFGAEVRSGR